MKRKVNKQKTNDAYDYYGDYDFKYNSIAVVGKNGKFGYINRTGEEITPLKYDKAFVMYPDFGEVCVDGKWGLVDVSGREITPIKYDTIKWTQIFDIPDICIEEWAKVKCDGKWGCLDTHGNEFIPLKYDEIDIAQHGRPHVSACIDGKWGFVDDDGTEITRFEYDSVVRFEGCRARVKKNGKYGFIDNNGVLVIPAIYDDCEPYFEYNWYEKGNSDYKLKHGLIWVEVDGKYGYIDVDGNEIIATVYEYATSLNEMAAVVLNGKVGFIDKTGKEVIPFMYEPDFSGGYDYRFDGEGYANVKLNGKWGVIDQNNNVILSFLYDRFLNGWPVGWRHAMRNRKNISIDTKGVERTISKNPDARTFRTYLQNVTWDEAKVYFDSILHNSSWKKGKEYKHAISVCEINFNNFKTKVYKSSRDVIRICGTPDRPYCVIYCSKGKVAHVYFDWAEILDMEVRIEDGLTLPDAEIVALCIWRASDDYPDTEEKIKRV